MTEQDSSSQWPDISSDWTERSRSSLSTWRTRRRPLRCQRAAPEFPFPQPTGTTTCPRTSAALSCSQVRLPPSAHERRVNGRWDTNVSSSPSVLAAGGWWFSSCGDWNLNGRFPRRPSGPSRKQTRKMFWTSKGQRHSVRTTLLKIAPATMKLGSDVKSKTG